MKFTLKAMVAALALSAATVPAQAAMQTVNDGDSSLVLSLLDIGNNLSATFDLGYTYSQFNTLVSAAQAAGGSFSWNLTSGAFADAWNSFSASANLTNTKWAVYAGDNTGSLAGDRGIISTYSSGTKSLNSNALQNAIAGMNPYFTNNNLLGTQATAADGASFVASNTSLAFAGRAAYYGSTGKINNQGFVMMNTLNNSMNVVSEVIGSTAAAATVFTTLGNPDGNYQFAMSSNGALSFTTPVAAVPEADSYAMMMIGLGLVGFVVRRRTQ